MDSKSSSAANLPPPFDPSQHKPYERMSYSDRMKLWREYGFYKKLSNETRVITDKAASQYVAEQLDLIRSQFIVKFTPDDLIDPQYL